jgi:predicted metal-binding protein
MFIGAKSFKLNAIILDTCMSLETLKCPWCSAEVQMQINEVTATDTLTLKARRLRNVGTCTSRA